MFKLLLILLTVAGLNARPLHRLPNGRLKQLVQDEHMHNSVLKDTGVKLKQLPVPAEFCRQGIEPSRRSPMNMNIGMMKHEVGKRVSVLDEFRQGTENHLHILQELRAKSQYVSQNDKHDQREIPAAVYRQGTEPSGSVLMDLNTGLLKEHRNEIDRRVAGSAKWEVVSEHEDMKSQDSSEHKENLIAVPVELRRQGTEPSRRSLIDLNTGMPKEEISEMNRRVSGFYNPPAAEKRQGTEPSRRFLMDLNTGKPKEEISEMNRRVSSFYNPPAVEKRQGTEPSRRFLMDLNTGMLKEEISEMNRRVSGFYNPPAVEKRQGTEPSRRFLMDLNTGMVQHEVGEMNRRVSGFYNPPAYEMKQGTQNSHATLVDPRTGQLLPTLTELQRSTAPLDEFRQGTEYQPHILQELRLSELRRQGTEPSRNLLVDLNKEHQEKMGTAKWEVVSEHKDMKSQDSSEHKENLIVVPVELRRQGTEPSRRFLIDLNTGMPKEEISEMNRRVSGFYNPPAAEKRQGTEPSRRFLMDLNTGKPKEEISEMNRRVSGFYNPPAVEKRQGTEPSRRFLMDLNTGMLKEEISEMNRRVSGFYNPPAVEKRQGTEPSRRFLMDLNTGMVQHEVGEMNRRVSGFYNPPAYERRQGTQNSHATLVDPRTGQLLPTLTELQRSTAPLDEFRQGTEYQLHTLQELRLHDITRPQYENHGQRVRI